ncbi:MAG: DegV family protein, partial [Lachnospiraceae bacterium]|nr:DegV family protein [Lachnospiraceae bacterium]
LGSALSIHPILTIDAEGKLKVIAKVRGVKKSLHFLRDYVQEKAFKPEHQTILIGHASCPEFAEELANEVTASGLCKEYFISDIGPVIGSHVGKGMCAIVFLLKENRS